MNIDTFIRRLRKVRKRFTIQPDDRIVARTKWGYEYCPIEAVYGKAGFFAEGAKFLGLTVRDRNRIVRAADDGFVASARKKDVAHNRLRRRIMRAVGIKVR